MSQYSKAEVAKHRSKDSCWISILDRVYDVTELLKDHPGGPEVLLKVAGTDASDEYTKVGHSTPARDLLPKYEIGMISPEDRRPAGLSLPTPACGPNLRQISLEELAQHRSKKSCWIAVHNKVYDVTQFLNDHPGGPEAIRYVSGIDATEDWTTIKHSAMARGMMKKYVIGEMREQDRRKATSKKHDDAFDVPVSGGGGSLVQAVFFLVAVAALAWYFLTQMK